MLIGDEWEIVARGRVGLLYLSERHGHPVVIKEANDSENALPQLRFHDDGEGSAIGEQEEGWLGNCRGGTKSAYDFI